MKLIKSIVFCFALTLALAGESQAVVLSKGTDMVRATLTADSSNEAIVRFDIKPGWHIYAEPERDGGMPTRFEWSGVDAERVGQTMPEEFEFQGFQQFGYENKAYYKFALKDMADSASLKISWLTCDEEECYPQSASFEIKTPLEAEDAFAAENAAATASFVEVAGGVEQTLWMIILMAFLGGVILNFMPCIFPILSIKAISLVQSTHNPKEAKIEAFLYLLGVVVSFLAIASILVFLRAGGEAVGWGFQLQSPIFVMIMLVIFVIVFLLLIDAVTIRMPFIHHIGRISFARKRVNSFVTGFFAVLIASPCTGPFMGVAIGYTLYQPLYVYYPVFLALSLGYAIPFFLVGFFPNVVAKILPKPGKWMLVLRRIFAIPVALTCVWLAWVLYSQVNCVEQRDVDWEVYDEETVSDLVEEGKVVFLDFTAKWCITCLANEKFALSSKTFSEMVAGRGVRIFKADWTDNDEKIGKALEKYNRASVPLYVYCANKACEIMPQLLTPSMFENK